MNTRVDATSQELHPAPAQSRTRGGKYLTFCLADEEFGFEIRKVHEIIGLMAISPVPRTPNFIRGVINLRGKVIPVVDLRTKFDMPAGSQSAENCIIVVQVEAVQMGIIVDRVSEVRDIKAEEIEPPPLLGAAVDTQFILGIGKAGEKIRILLDIDWILNHEELEGMEAAAVC